MMPHSYRTAFFRFAALLTTVAVLAACGGGGGGSSSPPGPVATPTPSPAPSSSFTTACVRAQPASNVTPSVFTFTATPAVSVSVDGTVIGTTPVTATLSQCRAVAGFTGGAPHQVTFNAAVPYTVPVVQENNGNHTIYFNGAADTQNGAKIGTIAAAVARSPQSASAASVPANVYRRTLQGGYHSGEIVADRFYVKSRDTAAVAQRLHMLDAERTARVSELGQVDGSTVGRVVTIAHGSDLQSAMSAYRRTEGVTDVQPLHVRRPMSVPVSSQVNPMDTYFKPYEQWDMFQTGMPSAWFYSKGAGATIAVIDTGIDANHADIGPVGGTKLTYAESVLSGTTTVGPTTDTDGHGTNVAGIAGAKTNNGFGFAGTGYDVFLQAYKVIGGTTGDTGDEATAIRHAVANHADVINLSLGGADFDQIEHDAVEFALQQGVVVVAAAGNCGYVPSSDCDGAVSVLDFPAGYDGVISVGASAYDDSNTQQPGNGTEFVAGYSQGAPNLSLVAPGGGARGQGGDITSGSDNDILHWIYNIYSTTATQACADKTNCKALFVGTSQATPHVSGGAALIVAATGHTLRPAAIKTLLESTADDIKDPKQGHGRLDVYRALAAAKGDTAPPAYMPAYSQFVAFAYANSGGTVPGVLDVNFPKGVPVASDGTFRIADVSPTAIGPTPGSSSYKIAVWYDANGNGVVDAGDEFGFYQTACNAAIRCTPGTINVARVPAGFVLP